MKPEKKQILSVLLGITVMAGLLAVMVYQTGFIEDASSQNPVLIETLPVKESTITPQTDQNWWDEKPTPISLN